MQADVLVLRADRPNIFPINDPIGAVVWGMDTSNVDWVFVGGRALMREGVLDADVRTCAQPGYRGPTARGRRDPDRSSARHRGVPGEQRSRPIAGPHVVRRGLPVHARVHRHAPAPHRGVDLGPRDPERCRPARHRSLRGGPRHRGPRPDVGHHDRRDRPQRPRHHESGGGDHRRRRGRIEREHLDRHRHRDRRRRADRTRQRPPDRRAQTERTHHHPCGGSDRGRRRESLCEHVPGPESGSAGPVRLDLRPHLRREPRLLDRCRAHDRR